METNGDTKLDFLSRILEVPHAGRWPGNFPRNRSCSEKFPLGSWFSPPPEAMWQFYWKIPQSRRTESSAKSSVCYPSSRSPSLFGPNSDLHDTPYLWDLRGPADDLRVQVRPKNTQQAVPTSYPELSLRLIFKLKFSERITNTRGRYLTPIPLLNTHTPACIKDNKSKPCNSN